jgi:hypothetical protein
MPPKSKRQAGYLGLIAGGKVKSRTLSQARAREMLRGAKLKRLPTRKRKRKGRK